ncbi:MAG: PDZ domain-containing protein, partial [Terriglobia bacterium]
YLPIGYSSFTSGYRQSDTNAVREGQSTGADLVVIIDPRFSRSITTVVPWTTPTTTTSYTTGTATAYGPGGGAVALGSSTTTTYGTSTAYLPMTVNRLQYGAFYLVKMRYRMGLRFRDLSDTERQQLQTNHGVYVIVVVDGTPAYESDILAGDIITSVDGSRIDGAASLTRMLPALAGQTVQLTIDRDGKVITKSIAVPHP